jgi:hypothetical protein
VVLIFLALALSADGEWRLTPVLFTHIVKRQHAFQKDYHVVSGVRQSPENTGFKNEQAVVSTIHFQNHVKMRKKQITLKRICYWEKSFEPAKNHSWQSK